MSILVAGQNDMKQISATSSDTSSATLIDLDFSKIISFSVYFKHAVFVTSSYVPWAIGDNTDWPIYENLGRYLKKWKNFSIKENGKNYLVESAVCGSNYTLYLLKEFETDKNRYLAYVQKSKRKGRPFFLDTKGWIIVSIYGGHEIAAGIDERGAIHIIPNSIVSSKNFETRIVFLPNMTMAISIAFQEKFIIALSSYHEVYSGKFFDDEFNKDNTLNDYKIIKISGKNDHCIALTSEGYVFARGKNEDGRLGTGNKQNSSVFRQIHVLKNQEIVDVSAGAFHSLFVNKAGKVYACGFDGFGETLQGDSNMGDVLNPKTTTIASGANFVMAGHQNSIVFVGCNVPSNSPNRTLDLVDSFPYPAMFKSNSNSLQQSQDEIKLLRTENANMKSQIISKDAKISQLDSTISQSSKSITQLSNNNKQLQTENNKLKNANDKLKNTIDSKNQEIENLKKEIENLKSQIKSKNDQKKDSTHDETDEDDVEENDDDDDYDDNSNDFFNRYD